MAGLTRQLRMLIAAALLGAGLGGCVAVAVGAAAAGAVHFFGEDTAYTDVDVDYDTAWQAAVDAVGTFDTYSWHTHKEDVDKAAGHIEPHSHEEDRVLEVTVRKLTESTVRVEAVGRKNKGLSPDVPTAQRYVEKVRDLLRADAGE